MGNLLFIASNRIGDALLSTGVLDYARSLAPEARVTIACGPLPAPLFRATPGLAALHVIEKKRTRGPHWIELWSALRGQRFDLAVDLRGTLLTYALNVKRRFVHRKIDPVRHKVEELTAFMDAPHLLSPHVTLDAKARADALAAVPGGEPILALGPGANFIGKAWPAERFAALARRLGGPNGPLAGARIVLMGGESDQRTMAEIVLSLDSDGIAAIDLAGKIDLLACAALLERATLFVGNDSGLMHVAAAVGAPTLGLFGPSLETIYGPYGPRARTLRGRPYEEIMAMFSPNLTHSLMEDIQVDAVEEAAINLLHAGGLR